MVLFHTEITACDAEMNALAMDMGGSSDRTPSFRSPLKESPALPAMVEEWLRLSAPYQRQKSNFKLRTTNPSPPRTSERSEGF